MTDEMNWRGVKRYSDISGADRLSRRVAREGECIVWTGKRSRRGYGRIKIAGYEESAARVAYTNAKGFIPQGFQVDHLCGNPPCVNPDHLEAVPPIVNYRRSGSPWADNARKTECIRGHSLSGENLYVLSDGSRRCKTCRTDAVARYRERKAQ